VTAWERRTRVGAAVALLGLLFTRDVQAYLDPGAGSLAFQVVVATLAAVAYGARAYWSRLKGVFARLAPTSSPDAPDRDV
jgi:CO/xanthine dehydrogenase Mo-binding subunit